MFNHLFNICQKEKVSIKDDALYEIIKLSNGCLRDALSFLDKVSKTSNEITLDIIQDSLGVLTKNNLEQLYNSIKNNDKYLINEILDLLSNSGITPLNFVNDFVDFLLNLIINNNLDYKEIVSVKDLIFKLNLLTTNFNTIVNPFILIKVELITTNYFPGNNFVDISQKNENKVENLNTDKDNIMIKNENNIKTEEKCKNIVNNPHKLDEDKLKDIRINNSFVNVSKEFKNDFINSWNSFVNKLSIEGNYTLIGYVENIAVQVVSKTNVLFSFNTKNESILFNDNVCLIENKYNEINNTNFKFLALSNDEWIDVKTKFIKNKEKKYEYIEEKNEESSNENVISFNLAEDIFGEEIIEIK